MKMTIKFDTKKKIDQIKLVSSIFLKIENQQIID